MRRDMPGDTPISRRSVLKRVGFGTGAVLAGSQIETGWAQPKADAGSAARGKPFRFVHMCDIHVQPESHGEARTRHALLAALELRPKPDFILTGGDQVYDVMAAAEPRAKELFDLYTSIMKDCDVPVHECIGNHDIFGWTAKGKVARSHVAYGKKMVQERLDLPSTYYSFDHGGWHFIILDDMLEARDTAFEAGIDQTQLAWLEADLKAKPTSTPTVVCVHVPIVSVAPYCTVRTQYDPGQIVVPSWINIPSWRVCRNAGTILQLLRHFRVPLVLAGHTHECETVKYLASTHINDGSVCCIFNGVLEGDRWDGNNVQERPGFGVIDLKPDGTFEHYYHEHGWEPATG